MAIQWHTWAARDTRGLHGVWPRTGVTVSFCTPHTGQVTATMFVGLQFMWYEGRTIQVHRALNVRAFGAEEGLAMYVACIMAVVA